MSKILKKIILYFCLCFFIACFSFQTFNIFFPAAGIIENFHLEKPLYTLKYIVTCIEWSIFSCVLIFVFIKLFIFIFSKENKKHTALIRDSAQAEKIIRLFNAKCEGRKALMITGEWGYGKTSFYKESLKYELEKMQRKMIEVSCFGISSTEDLVNQILNGLFFIEGFSVFLNYARSMLSCSSSLKRGLIPKNLIIIIDDFERASVTQKSKFYIELLGLINYFIFEKNATPLFYATKIR